MSSLSIVFLLYLFIYACHARHLGTFLAEELSIVPNLLPKDEDVNKLNQLHDLETRSSISKKGQTQESKDAGICKTSANTIKETLLDCFLKAKEAFAEDISGNEGNSIIWSGIDNFRSMEKVQGIKRVTRSMLGNPAGDTGEAVDSKGRENAGDVDVMDYAQPHRKPPIHNEKH